MQHFIDNVVRLAKDKPSDYLRRLFIPTDNRITQESSASFYANPPFAGAVASEAFCVPTSSSTSQRLEMFGSAKYPGVSGDQHA